MLTQLKDQHVWIDGPGGRVGTHQEPWERNWSFPGIRAHVARGEMVGKLLSVGRLKEGHGMVVVENQAAATPELVQRAVEKVEALADAPGFVVDLRTATGGNEAHSMPLASAFCAKPVVYAKQKFRGGPGHGDFGPVSERTLPAGKKPFTKPVVVLLGPATMSSGEGLAMMFAALPNVTTVGSRTRGSSGNPKPVELKEVGVTVTFSRWVAMLPDGTPIEGRGVVPQVEAKFPASAFGAKDPVLEKALEVLKEKVK
jgi:C-terminal processing protease CtpA/Prc